MTVPPWISPGLIFSQIAFNGESQLNLGYTKYLLDLYGERLMDPYPGPTDIECNPASFLRKLRLLIPVTETAYGEDNDTEGGDDE